MPLPQDLKDRWIAPHNEDKMYCYLWIDQATPEKCTFGERWVKAGEDPWKDCCKRIRQSVGKFKHTYDKGQYDVICVWDVSELAKKINRYHPQSRMDDYIRKFIGHRESTRSEVHVLPALEVKLKVDKFLAKQNQPLPTATLSTMQYQVAQEVIGSFVDGHKIVLAELCARFGKTIWSSAVAVEQDVDVVIVASYVKTVFTSFATDITSFDQFSQYDHISTDDDDYQDQVRDTLACGRKVFIYLSLCNGSKRQKRIDYITSLEARKMLIVDEADFGAHQEKQALPLVNVLELIDHALIMTGTNADRAATFWPVDHMVSVTYPELLLQKEETGRGNSHKFEKSLRHFNVNSDRDLLAPDVKCYQMDLSGPVEAAIQAGEVDDEFRQLPSWAKFAANPMKAKGFFSRTLQSIFLGQGGHDELNADVQAELYNSDTRIAMMFLPDNTGTVNNAMAMAGQIAKDSLPGFDVITLAGTEKYNGQKMTNQDVERMVKEKVEKCRTEHKSLLILASKMGQRSFSVPEITHLFLSYDNGQMGATLQKMSRTLTPNGLDKIGRIYSLSFDPNRDDKFDSMVIETALNYKRRHNIADMRAALRTVLCTIDIYKCTEDGAVKIDDNAYLEQAMTRKGIERVIGKIVDFSKMTPTKITAFAQANGDYSRQDKQTKTEKGKTRDKSTKAPNTKAKTDKQVEKERAKARETIVNIVENLKYIIIGTRTTTLEEAFARIATSVDYQERIKDEFQVGYEDIIYLFEHDIINQDLVGLIHKYD